MEHLPLTLETLAARLTILEHDKEKNSVDHGKIYGRLEALENGQGVITTKLDSMFDLMTEMRTDLKSITDKPAKRWDMIVSEFIKGISAAALGYFIGKGN